MVYSSDKCGPTYLRRWGMLTANRMGKAWERFQSPEFFGLKLLNRGDNRTQITNNTSMFPQFARLLSDEQVTRVHEASLEILDGVGLEVNNQQARQVFERHGCHVDEAAKRVKMPPKVIEEFTQAIPPRFTFRALDAQFDRTVPDDAPLMITASSAPHIIDPVSGQQRWANSQDIARIAHLVNNLPGVDLFSVPVLAADAPPGQYGLTRFYAALKHCRKPVRGSGEPGGDCESILELAYTIAGSERAYKDHPFITHHYCPIISPLKMDDNSTELLMYYTEKGLPGHPSIVPNGGTTSPMTLAGTIAQGNAEFLAVAALTQMIRPGTPTLYSTLPTVSDMRSGAYAPGGVECGMLNMAHAQMAKFYNIPSSGYIGLTNSKLVDAQAGYEKALSVMGGLLAGMHVLQFVGLIDALLAFDYGMAVIDNEISLMLKRMARGMEFSEDNLALRDIAEVGPGGMFLTSESTLKWMADGAFLPEIADRRSRESWLKSGGHDAATRARWRAQEILAMDCPSMFSAKVDHELRRRFHGMLSGTPDIPEGR